MLLFTFQLERQLQYLYLAKLRSRLQPCESRLLTAYPVQAQLIQAVPYRKVVYALET